MSERNILLLSFQQAKSFWPQPLHSTIYSHYSKSMQLNPRIQPQTLFGLICYQGCLAPHSVHTLALSASSSAMHAKVECKINDVDSKQSAKTLVATQPQLVLPPARVEPYSLSSVRCVPMPFSFFLCYIPATSTPSPPFLYHDLSTLN